MEPVVCDVIALSGRVRRGLSDQLVAGGSGAQARHDDSAAGRGANAPGCRAFDGRRSDERQSRKDDAAQGGASVEHAMKPATSTGDLLRIILVSLLVLAIGIIVAGILGDLTMSAGSTRSGTV